MNLNKSIAGVLVAASMVAVPVGITTVATTQPAFAFLKPKPNSAVTSAANAAGTQIKSGTTVTGQIDVTLDSGKNTDGDVFTMKLKPGLFGNKAFKGALLEGHIEGVQSAAKLGKKGALNVEFDDIVTADGKTIPIEAILASAPKPQGKMLRNMALVLGGAVAGHHVAKAAGAKHGALGGAVAGGAIALAMPGGNVVIKKGTELKVKFTKDVTI
ncbi:MAG: hypothetical protein JWM80_4448 [Cyanobacteria bacterium RYN_339]|nr:hypothetical protein [Cyanobacteria bacterium RYN_339]